MPFQKNHNEPLPILTPPCIHMRSKAMYVTGSVTSPDHPDEEGSHYFWCNVTQHVVGPDQADVDKQQCIPSRECYKETY